MHTFDTFAYDDDFMKKLASLPLFESVARDEDDACLPSAEAAARKHHEPGSAETAAAEFASSTGEATLTARNHAKPSDNFDLASTANAEEMASFENSEVGAQTRKGFKRLFASHNYNDRSKMVPEDIDIDAVCPPRKGGVPMMFPSTLHAVLEEADSQGHSDIISWQPHGRSFRIHDNKRFAEEILPQYFKHQKRSSFQRQLSLYGFTRLTRAGVDRGTYYNEYFLRQRPFLCVHIRRVRVKGTWVRKSASPELEPDFSAMTTVDDFEVMRNDLAVQQAAASKKKQKKKAQSTSDACKQFDRILNRVQTELGIDGDVVEPTPEEARQGEAQVSSKSFSHDPNQHAFPDCWVDTLPDKIENHNQANLVWDKTFWSSGLVENHSEKGIVQEYEEVPDLLMDKDLYLDLFDFDLTQLAP